MTQIASVLTSYGFYRLMDSNIATFYSQRRGAYTQDKNTYVELLPKEQEG